MLSAVASALLAATASAGTGKTYEVLSDPFKNGRPTVYTLTRGADTITFKHPFAGRFTRAEIRKHTKSGWVVTRFVISRDSKVYRPVLRYEIPFAIESSTRLEANETCSTNKSVINNIIALTPKVQREQKVSEKKTQLATAGFFDSSCSKIPDKHRQALMMAAAEVMTPEAGRKHSPVLQCLIENNFADVAGDLEAKFSQVETKQSKPRLALMCGPKNSTDIGNFDQRLQHLVIAQQEVPDRQDYTRVFVHESIHSVKISNHSIAEAASDCCVDDGDCVELKTLASAKEKGERISAAIEALAPESSIDLARITAATGLDFDAITIGGYKPNALSPKVEPGQGRCLGLPTEELCASTMLRSIAIVELKKSCTVPLIPEKKSSVAFNRFLSQLIGEAHGSEEIPCGHRYLTDKDMMMKGAASSEAKTLEQVAEIRQLGPLDWNQAASVPVQQAQAETKTDRAPASIPLPRMSVDSSSGAVLRSTPASLFDVVSSTADRVTSVVTPKAVGSRKLNPDDIPVLIKRQLSAKVEPQIITTNFDNLTTKASLVSADFTGINLSFTNPFVAQTNALLAKATVDRPSINGANGVGNKVESAKKVWPHGPVKSLTDSKAQDPANTATNPIAASPLAGASDNANVTTQNRQLASPPINRERATTRDEVISKLVSKYDQFLLRLKDPVFEKDLVDMGIQAVGKNNEKFGAKVPKERFVYDPKRDRLIKDSFNGSSSEKP